MLVDIAERLDAAIDERPGRWLAILSAIFLAMALVRAGSTPFQSDEVVTVWMSATPSAATMTAALKDGADDRAPLYPLVARLLHLPAGPGRLITRAAAIAGFFVAAIAVFVIVRRRAGPGLALAAALLLCFTAAERSAVEARGYVPAMASVAVALYAWTEAAAGRRRALHAALLATALAAGVWWDYSAAMAFLPVLIGELIRWRRRAKADWPIWGALGLAAAAALPLASLVVPAVRNRAMSSAGPFGQVAGTYAELLAPMGGWLLVLGWLTAIGIALASIAMVLTGRDVELDPRAVPAHEIAAAAAFLLLPGIIAVSFGLVGRAVGARDVLVAAPGLLAGAVTLIHRITPRSGIADVILVGTTAASFMGLAITSFLPGRLAAQHPVTSRPSLMRVLQEPGEPVIVAGGARALQLAYYAAEGWADRAVVLADPDLAREYTGAPWVDRRRLALGKWTSAPVEPFYPYTAITRSFYVYDTGADWLVPKLRQLRASIEEAGTDSDGTLYRVRLRAP